MSFNEIFGVSFVANINWITFNTKIYVRTVVMLRLPDSCVRRRKGASNRTTSTKRYSSCDAVVNNEKNCTRSQDACVPLTIDIHSVGNLLKFENILHRQSLIGHCNQRHSHAHTSAPIVPCWHSKKQIAINELNTKSLFTQTQHTLSLADWFRELVS